MKVFLSDMKEDNELIEKNLSKNIYNFLYIYTFLFYIFIVILRIYYEYIILINDYIVVFIIMIL